MTMNSLMETSVLLGKEFWGILNFEMNLPALAELLRIKSMGIDLRRFGDWVVFPDKISLDVQKRFLKQLDNRRLDPNYQDLCQRKMDSEEEKMDQLIKELLQIKYGGSFVYPTSFQRTLNLDSDSFHAIFFQFVGRGYLSANDIFQRWYPHFKHGKEGT